MTELKEEKREREKKEKSEALCCSTLCFPERIFKEREGKAAVDLEPLGWPTPSSKPLLIFSFLSFFVPLSFRVAHFFRFSFRPRDRSSQPKPPSRSPPLSTFRFSSLARAQTHSEKKKTKNNALRQGLFFSFLCRWSSSSSDDDRDRRSQHPSCRAQGESFISF